jgi:hypothetical protein
MSETISPEIQRMVARFGGAAVAAGLLTPAIAFPEMIVGCTRLVIDAEIRVSYGAVAGDDGILS